MWEYAGYLIAFAAIVAWTLGLYGLRRRGLLEAYGLQAIGPLLMWKTVRGRNFIDRLAKLKRFWSGFGDASLVIVAATMAVTTFLLAWQATLVQSPAVRENAPSPVLLLGIPGVNPLIPLWYGIFGLAVAIVLHEFAHGILARVAKIRIRSLGAIFVVVPIGAFVEPDEDEMRAMPRRQRARLFAAGPAMNVVLAIVFAVLFSVVMMTSVSPVHAGAGIVGFTEGSPAQAAGMQAYTIVTEVNGTAINSYADFRAALATVQANVSIPIVAYDGQVFTTYDVTPAWDTASGRPIIGVFAMDTSTDYYHPLTSADRFGGVPGAILVYISLPFSGRAPLQPPVTDFYVINGPLAVLPPAMFWILANVFYWLFWLSIMLGATNSLPAVPLDGGYILKDAIEAIVRRTRRGWAPAKRDRVVRQVTLVFAFSILFLILWQFIGPRI